MSNKKSNKEEKKESEKFDFWNPKYYEHDDIIFPWRKGKKIPGVNAPPEEVKPKEKEKKNK